MSDETTTHRVFAVAKRRDPQLIAQGRDYA